MGVDPISVTIAAAAAAASYQQQRMAAKDAASAQKKAARTAQNARMNKEFETRRQQIRQERVRRAQIEQQSENSGVSMSSGQIGSESAINTQVGANISAIQGESQAANAIGRFNQQTADANYRGQVASQIGSLGMSAASLYSNYSAGAAKAAAAGQGVGRTTNGNMSPVETENPYNINLFQ